MRKSYYKNQNPIILGPLLIEEMIYSETDHGRSVSEKLILGFCNPIVCNPGSARIADNIGSGMPENGDAIAGHKLDAKI